MTSIAFPQMSPTVNRNGTDRKSLIDQRQVAFEALRHASEALKEHAPHGRDYPAGYAAFSADRDIFWSRMATLTALSDVLLAESLKLMAED